MTSILLFKTNKGKQLILVGDTQHTYLASTFQKTKIFNIGNRILFCGAGEDKVIEAVYNKLVSQADLSSCVNKILSLNGEEIDGRYAVYDVNDRIKSEDIQNTEFMVIDLQDLEGKKIKRRNPLSLGNIEIIGSGGEFIGQIQNNIENLFSIKFEEHQEEFFKVILQSFCMLGRNDASTGHPAIFQLEVFVLDKENSFKRFYLRFKPEINKFENYEVIEEDD